MLALNSITISLNRSNPSAVGVSGEWHAHETVHYGHGMLTKVRWIRFWSTCRSNPECGVVRIIRQEVRKPFLGSAPLGAHFLRGKCLKTRPCSLGGSERGKEAV